MQLEMKDPESIHSPNTETVIGNYRWNGDLKTKFQAKENMTLISRVTKKTKPLIASLKEHGYFLRLNTTDLVKIN